MKKPVFTAALLALSLSLSACAGSGGQTTKKAGESDHSGSVEKAGSSTASTGSAKIEEQVLIDESGIKITATGLDDGFMGTNIKLLIENNSEENLTVQARDVSVNGYMVDCSMSTDIAAGKKVNSEITIMDSSLDECEIENIADAELSFHVFNADSWDTYLDTEPIQILTSIHDNYEYKFNDSGTEIYSENGVKIVEKGLSKDELLGPELKLYIDNESGKYLTIQARNVSVNGFMIDSSMSVDVPNGKRAINGISLLKTSLDENGITDITDMEFSLVAIDENFNTIFETNMISLNL